MKYKTILTLPEKLNRWMTTSEWKNNPTNHFYQVASSLLLANLLPFEAKESELQPPSTLCDQVQLRLEAESWSFDRQCCKGQDGAGQESEIRHLCIYFQWYWVGLGIMWK